ncbi:hypothetical protein [Pseudobacter ginsenosidimutans]|uniref:hypothetical protein n=1 Tax=Pseudobacter ginsenosidimutans TaxID=661488 RepID=UPI0013154916|nr:hypothetical protein [Pseudobacter ginsenosidimutans]
MKKIHVLLLASCAFIFSCSKDDNNHNTTPLPQKQKSCRLTWPPNGNWTLNW